MALPSAGLSRPWRQYVYVHARETVRQQVWGLIDEANSGWPLSSCPVRDRSPECAGSRLDCGARRCNMSPVLNGDISIPSAACHGFHIAQMAAKGCFKISLLKSPDEVLCSAFAEN